ncbi:hypothetical protein JBL43_16605 [Aureibaculum sp. A20]|uniref:DUF4190 domain-containing protein n=1 Tax=Aureibaculum flavum TaxID=2795986 RepID=A0ABS0WV53_9FLAO|nr:hypothetical protein [Aureibaculum flavum]MBJ2175877.1 hypothetical protein [Aureibaculum flavum]
MTETLENKSQENNTEDIKLYAANAITMATFFGGPLAAGYLIGENFKALNKPTEGKFALLIGIVASILLLVGMFMIPEHILDNIPNFLIPAVYTAIIWGILEARQGVVLKQHKENNNSFFSGWRAAGVGIISLIILLLAVFGYAYLSTDADLYDEYDTAMAEFSKNETESLVFYNHLETATNTELIKELEEKTIPTWKKNIKIINNTNVKGYLPPDLVIQNEHLLKYSELRLQAFQLFRKALQEDTDAYTQQLEQIHQKIDTELENFN